MCNNVSEALNRASVWCIFPQRNMRAPPIIIGGEFSQDPSQVLFVEHEYATEGSVVVADNICRRPVPAECLGNLVCQPLRRRMPSHRKPQQLPPAVAEHKKSEELLKRRSTVANMEDLPSQPRNRR